MQDTGIDNVDDKYYHCQNTKNHRDKARLVALKLFHSYTDYRQFSKKNTNTKMLEDQFPAPVPPDINQALPFEDASPAEKAIYEGSFRLGKAMINNLLKDDHIDAKNAQLKESHEIVKAQDAEIGHLNKLLTAAKLDPLTGLPRRDSLELTFTRLAVRKKHENARRSTDEHNGETPKPTSVIMIDIDNFKKLNDTHGHAAGDVVLLDLGKLFRDSLKREDDFACRWGGEEFVLILESRDTMEATAFVDSLREKFTALNGMSFSAGISPFDGESLETVLGRSDAAMYAVKHSGEKGRTMVWDESLPERPL